MTNAQVRYCIFSVLAPLLLFSQAFGYDNATVTVSPNTTYSQPADLKTGNITNTLNVNIGDNLKPVGATTPLIGIGFRNGEYNFVLQFVISGAAAGAALFGANIALDWRRSPKLSIDPRDRPVGVYIDIPIYSLSNPNLPSEWRQFTVRYIVNRIIVRNNGRTAAENCKGSLKINQLEEKVCWYLERERYTMTINAKSMEYLDVCATLDPEIDRAKLIQNLRAKVESLQDSWTNTLSMLIPLDEVPIIKEEILKIYNDKNDIPLFIAPTEDGWSKKLHELPKLAPGSATIQVSSKNAKPIKRNVTILERPENGIIIQMSV